MHALRQKDVEISVPTDVKEVVREKYGLAALRVKTSQGVCCGTAPNAEHCCDPVTSNLYDAGERRAVPAAALETSPGCGNPAARADRRRGG